MNLSKEQPVEYLICSQQNIEQIRDHFLRLNDQERYCRFCTVMNDELINQYVNSLNFNDIIVAAYCELLPNSN